MTVRLFCRMTALAVPALAVLVLLAPGAMLPARAQAAQPAQQAALADNAKPDPATSQTVGTGNVAAVDPAIRRNRRVSPPRRSTR